MTATSEPADQSSVGPIGLTQRFDFRQVVTTRQPE